MSATPASFSTGGDGVRERIREFLAAHPPPSLRGLNRTERVAAQRRWSATLFDSGLAGPAWPRQYGGMDLTFAEQVAYHSELAHRHVPGHPGNGPSIAGPTLIRFASAEQKDRFLPAMLRSDEVWAQGFSEPGAGSDLQSLRTRAVRDGDHYVVNGTKIWSTYAEDAEIMFALVRTGPKDSGAAGISYLLIDLRSTGVTVTPVRDMTGESRFSQVFFDEVRVPVLNRIGEENRGWPMARATLGNERAVRALSQASAYRRRIDEFAQLLTSMDGLGDPTVRDRLARCEMHVRILMFNAVRVVESLSHRGVPGPSSSIARLYHSLVEQEFYELTVAALGQPGHVAAGPRAIQGGRFLKGLLHARGATIGAGTAEIQRNTIAEQILGLPHDAGSAPPQR